MKRLIAAVVLVGMICFGVNADPVNITTTGVVWIQVMGSGHTNPGAVCISTTSGGLYFISPTDVAYESMLSVILTCRAKNIYFGGFYESTKTINENGTHYQLTVVQLQDNF